MGHIRSLLSGVEQSQGISKGVVSLSDVRAAEIHVAGHMLSYALHSPERA